MTQTDIEAQFEAFVRDRTFPCVGAKSALATGHMDTVVIDGDFGAEDTDVALYLALLDFADKLDVEGAAVQTFCALFPGVSPESETAFEHKLWATLQRMNHLDAYMGERWSPDTSADPRSAKFSLSFGGESFFVIGLHPKANRPARRFSCPALVFNSNAQFAKLRADGRYYAMQKIIRQRDEALAGEINPMLDDFGERSEARQYSGRQVGENWQCPFSAKAPVELDDLPATGVDETLAA